MYLLNNRSLFLSLGCSTAVTTIFSNLSIFGVGLAVINFLILGIFCLVHRYKNNSLTISNEIIILSFIFILHLHVVVFSLVISNNLYASDTHYLLSHASNFIWVIMLVVLTKNNPRALLFFSYSFITVSSMLIILIWILGYLDYNNYYYLRLNSLDNNFLEATIFNNPNSLGRNINLILAISFLLLVFSYKKYQKILLILSSLLLSFIAMLTLSRTNIFVLILLVFFFILIYKNSRKGISYKEIRYYLYAMIFLCSALVSINQELNIRFLDTIELFARMVEYHENKESRMPIRLRSWHATVETINNNIFGVSPHNEEEFQRKYGAITYSENSIKGDYISIHGGFLKIAAYFGILSLLTFLVFFFFIILYAKKVSSNLYAKKYASVPNLLVLLVFIILVSNITADTFGMPITWITLGIFISFTSFIKIKYVDNRQEYIFDR